jgi:hypothetical protein
VATGCGAEAKSGASKQAEATEPTEGPPVVPPQIDFNGPAPIVGASKFANIDQAAEQLSFTPIAPTALGEPSTVSVGGDTLGLTYDDQYGHYWLIEAPAHSTTTEDLRAQVAGCDPSNGCTGTWAIQNLENGASALTVTEKSKASTVIWLANGLLVRVEAGSDAVPIEKALTIANVVEAAAA